jgi:hypothetical protein
MKVVVQREALYAGTQRAGNGDGKLTDPIDTNDTTAITGGQMLCVHFRVGGKVVGHVAGDTFHKCVRGSRHRLRKPPAWALDVQNLANAETVGAQWVEMRDEETGRRYRAAIAEIRLHGFAIDRGFGRQIGLSLNRWELRPQAQQLTLLECAT